MRTISILGSPRKNGNTATVLNSIEKNIINNHEIERINISDYDINGCLGCSECQKEKNKPGCIQNDDADKLLKKLIDSELIIYATPLYGHCYSSQLKTFLDRQVALFKFIEGKDKAVTEMEMKSLIDGKSVILIVTCQGPIENNTEIIKLLFDKYCETSKTISIGKFIIPFCTDPSKVLEKSQNEIEKIIQTIQEHEKQKSTTEDICNKS